MLWNGTECKKKNKVMRISCQLSPLQIMTDQKQFENVEYFKYLDSMIKNDPRCTHKTKSRTAMGKAAFNIFSPANLT
jgi:hypothetical protein